uniref:Uncharacterized protein n=1 Tax=Candidatus Kentrum eta TaxID=2126337 RepID=A0A450V9A9_9GAMM|nr:MAG: Protein of unknown function (DUF2934) [Candidatus Kentron sp. H]VFK01364.1 MAG: Protein of unknown function (DUF2934) [Candidatus Kentron sp. H]VFK04957.1 MAG: Protein of unknown function (DUF2934) [Candidatus Kentron sp. H]
MVRRPSFELAFEFLKRAMFRQQNTSMSIGKQFHSVALPGNLLVGLAGSAQGKALTDDGTARKPDRETPASDAITPEERWNMIAVAAYYRAEQRGFLGGRLDCRGKRNRFIAKW